jgi:PAS domain S-box-containing protein
MPSRFPHVVAALDAGHDPDAERRLRFILDNSPDVAFEQDTDLRLTWVSRNGRGVESLIGKADGDFLPPEEAHRVGEIKRRVMRTGRPERFACAVTFGGASYDFEMVAHRHERPDGKVTGVICYARDVTDHRRAERELRDANAELTALNAQLERRVAERTAAAEERARDLARSEQKLRSIVDSMGDGVMVTDAAGNFVLFNPAVERILGKRPTDMPMQARPGHYGFFLADGETPYEHDRLPLARALRGEAIDGEEVFVRNEARPAGVWISVTARPLCGETGAVDGIGGGAVMVIHDTTDRRHAEEDLRYQKSLLEAQSEASIDGILVVGEDGRILSFNRRYAEMWNVPARVLQQHSDDAALAFVRDQLADPEEFLWRVENLYRHPDECSREEIQLKDGRTFDRFSAPVRSPDGRHYGRVWFFRDVTDRRRAEDALRELAERNRLLASEVNHRVGNNLAGLLGLVAETSARATDVRGFAAAIEGRLRGMAQVHRMLSEAGWASLDLRALVRAASDAMQRLAPHKAEVVADGPPLSLRPGQALPLMMTLAEWFANSAKYGAHSTEGGRVEIRWGVVVDHDGRNPLVRLTWRERGGPPITAPAAPSLGTDLVTNFVTRELAGQCRLGFPREGATHEIEFPVEIART